MALTVYEIIVLNSSSMIKNQYKRHIFFTLMVWWFKSLKKWSSAVSLLGRMEKVLKICSSQLPPLSPPPFPHHLEKSPTKKFFIGPLKANSPLKNNLHVNFLDYPFPSGGDNSSHPLTPYRKLYNIVSFMFIYL